MTKSDEKCTEIDRKVTGFERFLTTTF